MKLNILTIKQIQTLHDAFRGHLLEALIRLALATGMRRSGLLNLKWQDVDLEKREIRFLDVKTNNPDRALISDEIALLLEEHHLAQMKEQEAAGADWENFDLVFPGRHGKPQSPHQLISAFHEVVEQAGMPGIHFHDLRATVTHRRYSQYKAERRAQ